DLIVVLQGRSVVHQVGPFNQHIGVGKGQGLAAYRVNGKKADVGLSVDNCFHRLGGSIVNDQLAGHPQVLRQCLDQVNGDARGTAGGISAGQDGVAHVDAGTQGAGGRQGSDEFGGQVVFHA